MNFWTGLLERIIEFFKLLLVFLNSDAKEEFRISWLQ